MLSFLQTYVESNESESIQINEPMISTRDEFYQSRGLHYQSVTHLVCYQGNNVGRYHSLENMLKTLKVNKLKSMIQ